MTFPGKFNEGVREGPAEWITKGYSYKGFFRNDQPYGKGKFTFENGCEQHGFHKVGWSFSVSVILLIEMVPIFFKM